VVGGTTPGGTTETNLGTACALPTSGNSVTVTDPDGFFAGETVEIYNRTTGQTEATGVTIHSVVGHVITFNSNVTFSGGPAATFGCSPAYSEVVVGELFGIPVGGSPAAGTEITLYANGHVASSTVFGVSGGYIWLNGAEAIAQALGGCYLSRGVGPFPGTTPAAEGSGVCEPGSLAPSGTLVTTGPATGGTVPPTAAPPNPYPFWQWVPSAAPAGGSTSGTVYSDNHGEAIVALNTPFSYLSETISPVPSGGCPNAYVTVTNSAGVATGCILPLSALGTAPFGSFANVSAVNAAAANTCFNTPANGGAPTAAPTATGTPGPAVGANGPLPGQICKNALGAIEFGAGATLGSTTVQAIAEYPYTRGEHPQISSGTLTKVWTSLFMKSVALVGPAAGTPGPAGTTTFTVQITAQDICGNPISIEPIQVSALGNAGSVVVAPMAGTGGTVVSTSSNSAVVTVGSAGTATLSVEVLNTAIGTQGLVLKVVFPFENIERFLTLIPGTTTPTFFQQSYGPGWNQVGGPAGSNFGVAEALFT
jgi:hypothetical protein